MSSIKPALLAALFSAFLETASLVILLRQDWIDIAPPAYFAVHGAASVMIGFVISRHMLVLYPETRRSGVFYFSALAFLVPVLGISAMLFFLRTKRVVSTGSGESAFDSVEGITFFSAPAASGPGFSRAGVRPILRDGNAPQGLKLKALLALQSVSTRAANNLIREQLGESADDVRLLAYGLLDAREKALDALIHEAKVLLAEAGKDEHAILLRQLAELYWELVYRGIAQGSLLQHAVKESKSYISQSLEIDPGDAGAWALHGRLLLREGRRDEAETAFGRAVELGLARSRVWPYLAEIAFQARDYPRVRKIMSSLNHHSADALSVVASFWKTDERIAGSGR